MWLTGLPAPTNCLTNFTQLQQYMCLPISSIFRGPILEEEESHDQLLRTFPASQRAPALRRAPISTSPVSPEAEAEALQVENRRAARRSKGGEGRAPRARRHSERL